MDNVHHCALCGEEIGGLLLGLGLESEKLTIERASHWIFGEYKRAVHKTTWFCEPCIVKKLLHDNGGIRG